jgi:hypothetical protein
VAAGQYFAAAPEQAAGNLRRVSGKRKPLEGATVVADRAYCSADNVPAAKARGIPAIPRWAMPSAGRGDAGRAQAAGEGTAGRAALQVAPQGRLV